MYGWTIWEDKTHRFIEAEFHAVVLEHGELVDITPRQNGEEKIMFVIDQQRKARRLDESSWETWAPCKFKKGVIQEDLRPIIVVTTT